MSIELQYTQTIDDLDTAEWDRCLATRGTFSARGLAFLEDAFGPANPPEHAWKFHYFVAREHGRPLAATFFTDSLWKDDLFAPAEESARIETLRARDRYLMTSRVLSMGSLLTEGNHLFVDYRGNWAAALEQILERAIALGEEIGSPQLILRDLPARNLEVDAVLRNLEFNGAELPPSMVIPIAGWEGKAEFIAKQSKKHRWELRRKVFSHDGNFRRDILTSETRAPTRSELAEFYALYREVHARSLELNTFALLPQVFQKMADHPDWELLILRLSPEVFGQKANQMAAWGACFAGAEQYAPMVVGLDYDYVEQHGVYRQALWAALSRARQRGAKRLCLGMGAPLEKARFGAVSEPCALYERILDKPDSA